MGPAGSAIDQTLEEAMELTARKCVPCAGGVPRLVPAEIEELLRQVVGWSLAGDRLSKHLQFKDFNALMVFVNRMAEVAEGEGHHPDFTVHYNQLDVSIWTHAVGGLTESDFILAAKLDALGTGAPMRGGNDAIS
jgi:4a-hydroxytetrahydrobiopterin dehydratase